MEKYIFSQKIIEKKYTLFFLCGTVFDEENASDKRIVLKKYIESINDKYKAIILEQNFIFRGESKKGYLAYDQIFLRNLFDVEMLMSLLADKIFIIHESISTAAELGMFASNPNIANKICLLVPDKINVEERKISKFIRMAFMNRSPRIRTIVFYPTVIKNKISPTKSDYHTYFNNNKIGENLGAKIKRFIRYNLKSSVNLSIKKARYNKPYKEYISYIKNEEQKN